MQIVASSPSSVRATTWQTAVKTAIRNGVELCRHLNLPEDCVAEAAEQQFPVFAPLGFLAKMRKGDPHDPLLRQVLPLKNELVAQPGFESDPVGDGIAQIGAGLLQKYHGRALLITTGSCAIHCRYCFRREYPYSDSPKSPADWQPALDRIAADASIDEVILSGGDPLTLTDHHLHELVVRIAKIPHVQRLRVHT